MSMSVCWHNVQYGNCNFPQICVNVWRSPKLPNTFQCVCVCVCKVTRFSSPFLLCDEAQCGCLKRAQVCVCVCVLLFGGNMASAKEKRALVCVCVSESQ